MTFKKSSMMSSLLLSLTLLTACETISSKTIVPEVVTIKNVHYSYDFEKKLLGEMIANDVRACAPIEVVEPCSAWKRAVIDYSDQREKIRIIEESN